MLTRDIPLSLSFDNESQDAAGPYPTLISQDLLLPTAHSPAWPCDHGAMVLVQQLFDVLLLLVSTPHLGRYPLRALPG